MKIQCDVCEKAEAYVFCPADEAALCLGCDRTIHHANKLASKHTRFSLQHPNSKEAPVCDICQERRAFLLCKEDRAILCRECDIPIHKANDLTQKHNRFLLTGVNLSAAASTYQASSSYSIMNTVTDKEVRRSNSSVKKRRSASHEVFSSPFMLNSLTSAGCKVEDIIVSDTASVSTSNISQYLIETIPGWCVEDLLHLPFGSHGFCKNYNHQSTFKDRFFENCTFSFPSGNIASEGQPQYSPISSQMVTVNGFVNKVVERRQPKATVEDSWSWLDDGYTVPQINPPSLM